MTWLSEIHCAQQCIIIRAVAVIVAMLTLATLKLRNEMSNDTQTILRAIAEFDSKSK